MQRLYLIRGLPGSGKSTLASKITDNVFEADQYFYVENRYCFDGSKLKEAHSQCRKNTERCLAAGGTCAVSNTFSQLWEMEPYIDLAKRFDVFLVVIDLFDSGLSVDVLVDRNTHDVPKHVIQSMKERWESVHNVPPATVRRQKEQLLKTVKEVFDRKNYREYIALFYEKYKMWYIGKRKDWNESEKRFNVSIFEDLPKMEGMSFGLGLYLPRKNWDLLQTRDHLKELGIEILNSDEELERLNETRTD